MKELKYTSPEQAERLLRSFSAWLLIEPFLANLSLGNRSPCTIKEYRKILHNFCLECDCSLHVEVNRLRAWVAGQQARGVKPRSIATRLTCLSSFFGFAVDEGLLTANPIARLPKLKLPKRLPQALSVEELRQFFNAVDACPSPERAARDALLFRVAYYCGLRVGEVTTLRIENVSLATGFLRVTGKGDKERSVPIREELAPLLSAWIGDRRRGWLFPGVRDTHLSARVVQQYCREYAKAAGLEGRVHPHTLRHSAATHYLQGGATITFVQRMLGHANLGTTGIYTQMGDADCTRIAREVKLAI